MKRIVIVLLMVGVITGCREQIFIDLDYDGDRMLSFVSTLSPESTVVADILPAISLTKEGDDVYPEQIQVFFEGSDSPNGQMKMVYDPQMSKYRLEDDEYRPSPGGYYEVMAYVPDSDIDTLHARTHIPLPMTISDIQVLKSSMTSQSSGRLYALEIAIHVSEPRMRPAYFQLIPRRKISTYRIDDDGGISITYTSRTSALRIDEISSSRAGVSTLVHEDGIYVDYSRMSEEPLTMTVSTPEPIDVETEIFKLLEVEIKTLSEELYLYHQSLHKQIVNNNGAYSTPVTHYTNVENGLGVLGSYSTRLSTIEINE